MTHANQRVVPVVGVRVPSATLLDTAGADA
jgi:hypothetical protein